MNSHHRGAGPDSAGDEARMEKDLHVEDERENFCIFQFIFYVPTLLLVAFKSKTFLPHFSCTHVRREFL